MTVTPNQEDHRRELFRRGRGRRRVFIEGFGLSLRSDDQHQRLATPESHHEGTGKKLVGRGPIRLSRSAVRWSFGMTNDDHHVHVRTSATAVRSRQQANVSSL